MKVKEVIAELQEFDGELEVRLEDEEFGNPKIETIYPQYVEDYKTTKNYVGYIVIGL